MPQRESRSGSGARLPSGADDPVRTLERWADFGGSWVVLARSDAGVTVSMRRCDGGEEQSRFTTADPDFLRWLGDRTMSTDD